MQAAGNGSHDGPPRCSMRDRENVARFTRGNVVGLYDLHNEKSVQFAHVCNVNVSGSLAVDISVPESRGLLSRVTIYIEVRLTASCSN